MKISGKVEGYRKSGKAEMISESSILLASTTRPDFRETSRNPKS